METDFLGLDKLISLYYFFHWKLIAASCLDADSSPDTFQYKV